MSAKRLNVGVESVIDARNRTLYVTSLRENLSAAEFARTPQAGRVFMLEPGVAGAPAALYQG